MDMSFRGREYRIKKLIIFAVIFFILTIGISVTYHFNAKCVIYSEILKIVENDVANSSRCIEGLIDEADRITSFLVNDNIVKTYLINGSVNGPIGNISDRLSTYISSYRYVYDYINSIYLYSEANTDFFYDGKNNVTIYSNDGWKELYDSCGEQIMSARAINNNYPIVLTYIRRTKYGGIIVNIDSRELQIVISESKNTSNKKYIIDSQGRIVYKYGIKELNENISDIIKCQSAQGSYIYKNDGFIYAVAVQEIPESDYKCVVVNKIDNSRINSVYFYSIAVMLILVCIGVVCFIFIDKITFKPFIDLVKFLENPNDKSVKLDNKAAKYIANRFLKEIEDSKELRTEILKQAEISNTLKRNLLGMQINPHFISSTLNLLHINMYEKFGDNYDDNEILIKTSRCISNIVRNVNDIVTIKEECVYSDLFVDILRLKSDGRVNISLNVDDNVSDDAKIIKLCVNTLVENAFYHGISAKEDIEGNINCRIYREDEDLICVVSDDGVGMSNEEIKEIKKRMKNYDVLPNSNIGLANIEGRVKLLFGEKYGVSIQSKEGQGTEIKLNMPYQT